MSLHLQSPMRGCLQTFQGWTGRWLLGLAVLAIGSAANAQGTPASEIKPIWDSFQAGGKTIRLEKFEPPAGLKKYPAVIVLHGSEGLEEAGRVFREQAQSSARKGYVVLLLHYFDRCDLPKPQLTALQKRFQYFFDPTAALKPEEVKEMEQHFTNWLDAVHGAIEHTGQMPNVERRRIGLVGFSLGGALALQVGAQQDPKTPRIAALASLFGNLPRAVRKDIKTLPPALMIHGDMDERIPPWEAYDLESHLKAQKASLEFKMYQRMGHCLVPANPLDVLDALQRLHAFLQKHLQDGAADSTTKP